MEDCKTDDDVKMSIGNDSRPPMLSAIRNEDGTLITDGVYDAIKASSRTVADSLLSITFKTTDRGRNKTKNLFKSQYALEWSDAITRLEHLQPLLRLCASHWKAEHVLSASLASATTRTDTGTSNTAVTSTKSRKRLAEDNPLSLVTGANKKVRQDDVTNRALRNLHAENVHPPTLQRSALATAAFSRRPKASETEALQPRNEDVEAVDYSYSNLLRELQPLSLVLY